MSTFKRQKNGFVIRLSNCNLPSEKFEVPSKATEFIMCDDERNSRFSAFKIINSSFAFEHVSESFLEFIKSRFPWIDSAE